MKRLVFLLAFVLFTIPVYMQETDSSALQNPESPAEIHDVIPPDDPEIVSVAVKDTIRLKIGNKGITILEDENGTVVKVTDLNENKKVKESREEKEIVIEEDTDDTAAPQKPARNKIKGHWAGFAFGLNNFVDKDFSISRTDENQFMDLNTSKSWNYNLNLFEQSFGLGSDKIGLVTGLGFAFNNYHFDGNNSITKDSLGNTVSLDYSSRGIHLEKTKLATTYLNLPVLLEFQFPGPPKKRLYFSVGVVGGLKIGSHTKVIYKLDGRQKDKIRDDFNLSPLRYAYTARVGYRNLQVYGNYYATPLFEKNRGPELFPIDVGLCLSF